MGPIQFRQVRVRAIAYLAAVLVLALFGTQLARAEVSVSPWLQTTAPVLDKLADVTEASLPAAIANGNQLCEKRDVITRPQRFTPLLQAKQSHNSCVINTGYGAVSSSGFLQRQGSTVSGAVRSSTGGFTTLVPIPRSPTGLVLSGGGFDGSNLYFLDNLDLSLNSAAITNGEVTHKLPPLSSATALRDRSGNLITASYDTMSFSANGDWMVVYVPSVAMVRVNTKTREILPFGVSINTGSLGPSFRTAISPDGRYAVVASKVFDILMLYDLSTCGTVPNTIRAPVSCSSRDLRQLIKQKVPDYASMIRMRFRSNYTLDFYNSTQPGSPVPFYHQVLVAAGQQTSGFQYLALGDSFASGEGAYAYKAITDTNDNKCHTSQVSYPYLIASNLGYGGYESVACSGAIIDDVLNLSAKYNQELSQAKGMQSNSYDNEILVSFLPGYRGQKRFIEEYQPSIITISTVGNDIGFGDKIKRCLDSDTCYDTFEERLEIVQEINRQFDRLTDMYDQIKQTGDPRAKIYVIGYPKIGDPDGNCALNVHLNQQELKFANDLVIYLNSVVKTAANKVGVAYIDVENAFAGHRLCETDSWNVAVNGLTNGNDIVNLPLIHGPVANESYHPTAFGQYLFKTAIMDKTAGFTLSMPTANPNTTLPEIQNTLPLLNIPPSNPTRPARIIQNYTGTDGGFIEFGKTWLYEYSGLSDIVQAGSSVRAVLNSVPVELGNFPVDTLGNVTILANIPNTVPSGFHTLHLYGKNSSGEEVDIYKTFYVSAASTSDPCIAVPSSGVDADKDNIDDACDPFIDQPPLIVEPVPVIPLPPISPPDDPIIPDPDPKHINENPQVTAPPYETTTPQDPKPPENNPETVAGHEQLVSPPTETASTTIPIQLAVAVHASTSPLLTPAPSSTAPQVAAATTSSTERFKEYQAIPEPSAPIPRKQLSKWLLIPVALLIVATLSVLILIIRHPK